MAVCQLCEAENKINMAFTNCRWCGNPACKEHIAHFSDTRDFDDLCFDCVNRIIELDNMETDEERERRKLIEEMEYIFDYDYASYDY